MVFKKKRGPRRIWGMEDFQKNMKSRKTGSLRDSGVPGNSRFNDIRKKLRRCVPEIRGYRGVRKNMESGKNGRLEKFGCTYGVILQIIRSHTTTGHSKSYYRTFGVILQDPQNHRAGHSKSNQNHAKSFKIIQNHNQNCSISFACMYSGFLRGPGGHERGQRWQW